MRLLGINLEAFRNLESVRLSFVGDRIFFLGPNGQGKTNLLEAIGMSGSLRSFRKSGMEGLVQEGKKKAQLFFRFCDDFGTEHEILLGFQGKGQKDLELNGEKITKLGDYLGLFPSVTLSSRDFRLVREGPSDRRKWLDLLLSSSSPEYLECLQTYHRALRERNALLKRGGGEVEFSAFEQVLARSAVSLQSLRALAFPEITGQLEASYCSLSDDLERAGLAYYPNLSSFEVDELIAQYSQDRERDRLLGSTRHGPHKDDFKFLLDQRDARSYASEGQQRGLVLALRLAEFSYLHRTLEKIPLLLADDVLGELDANRKANFKKLLPPKAQVFATGTSYPSEEEKVIWETFSVSGGTFSKSNP
ncbi:MAG: DNA replication and repair protein RecF [Verrucomicrobiota bacterium]|nr:DNA replication and repair protein RecF [Verrucomicrobiota bacterium]